jgi:hypothetical protein
MYTQKRLPSIYRIIFLFCDEKVSRITSGYTTFFGANNLIIGRHKTGIAFTFYMRREGRVTVIKSFGTHTT